jgi:cytochrome P450
MTTLVHELQDLPDLDLLGLDRSDALPLIQQARSQHWLAKGPFGFAVTHHEDALAVLRDKRWHSALSLLPSMSGIDDSAFMERRQRSILTMEGEDHTRLRRMVAAAFTPRAADRLRPFMAEVVDGLVDGFSDQGRCELVADLCEPYPIPIICELLGAPKSDWKLFSGWATDIFRIFNANLVEDLPLINKASEELEAYVADLIAERRKTPSDDLLSALIAAEEEGDRLSTEELVMLAEAVLMAGTDTTRNQLACSVALLVRHPDQWKRLGEEPELAAAAVEETMRVLGAVRGTGRVASEDITYRDVTFPAGTFLSISFQGANTDPDVWDDPDDFDITAERKGGPQMTFGWGTHYCLGASLARAELQEALPLLARRLRDLELDGDIEWKPSSFGIWGPSRLPLSFTPEHP